MQFFLDLFLYVSQNINYSVHFIDLSTNIKIPGDKISPLTLLLSPSIYNVVTLTLYRLVFLLCLYCIYFDELYNYTD